MSAELSSPECPESTASLSPEFRESFVPSENRFGITVAIFAAVLAINDLGAGRFGSDELALTNEKANAYQWFQSKGIKESLAEGQISALKSLMLAGMIAPDKTPGIQATLEKLSSEVSRYGKEKREILLGSKAVGKENWVQDLDGELGKITGAKEMEARIDALGRAGDSFDLASLFLQITLVVGALGLLLRTENMKARFYFLTLLLGTLGALACVWAYALALRA